MYNYTLDTLLMDNQQLFMLNLNQFINFKKGVITVIGFDTIEFTKTNLKSVIANCTCSVCGSVFKISLSKLLHNEKIYEHSCPLCKRLYRISQIEQRFKNVQRGVLKFIQFDHFEGTRAFIKCLCTRCGAFVIVRDDRLKPSSNPKSCSKCYANYTSIKVKKRYENLHHLSGVSYEKDKLIRNRIKSLKYGAKNRNISFNLTDKEAYTLLTQKCHYCGNENYIGIDRIDSTKDYSLNNCVPCCKYCNLMKNNLPYNFFIELINKIFKYCISNSTTIENTEVSESELSTLQANGNGNAENP